MTWFAGMRCYLCMLRLSLFVGGVAQWLERRSLAGGLSLIYAWLTRDHSGDIVSAIVQPTRATHTSVPSGSVNE